MGKLFSDIVGQKTAVSILSSQILSGSLSHAYILLGEEGTGKEYLAREFSKYILCENQTGEDSCENCKRFDKGLHPDFIQINGEEGIKIEEVRETVEKINLMPAMSKYKVIVFTKAENLGIEAANALLKTFEEPPKDSIIILTAISEKSLPATIISRGQKIKLSKINENEIKKVLLNDFEESEINKILPYAEGNIGEAKQLISDNAYFEAKKELFSGVEECLLSDSIIKKFKAIEAFDKDKRMKEFLGLFSRIIFQSNLQPDIINPEDEIYSKVQGKHSAHKILKMSEKTLKIYENLEYNVNLRLALEEIILESEISTQIEGQYG